MKTEPIAFAAIIILAIGMSGAIAFEFDVFKVFKDYELDYCVGTGEINDNQIIVNCRLSLQLGMPLNKAIDVRTTADDEKDLANFVNEIYKAIEGAIDIIIEPEPEPEPWIELNITEDSWLRLEEKRIEQEGIKATVIENCEGGKEQARLFQTPWHIVDIVSAIEDISDWENLTTADKKLIEECEAIKTTRELGNTYYPGMQSKDASYVPAIAERLRTGIFATSEDLANEAQIAKNLITNSTWMGFDPDAEPFANLKLPTSTVQRTIEEMEREDIETAEDVAEEKVNAQRKVCVSAWKDTGNGATAITSWWEPLKDGTCDDYIDDIELIKNNNENKALTAILQNEFNCPDCEEYW